MTQVNKRFILMKELQMMSDDSFTLNSWQKQMSQ